MNKFAVSILVLLSWITINAFAAPPTPEQIKTFMDVNGADEFINDSADASVFGQNLNKKEAEKIKKQTKEFLLSIQKDVISKVYSSADLDILIPFHKTDAGKLGIKRHTEFRRLFQKAIAEKQAAAKPK